MVIVLTFLVCVVIVDLYTIDKKLDEVLEECKCEVQCEVKSKEWGRFKDSHHRTVGTIDALMEKTGKVSGGLLVHLVHDHKMKTRVDLVDY
jgi:hypothetical protein